LFPATAADTHTNEEEVPMKMKSFALLLIASASLLAGCGDSNKMVGPGGTNNDNSAVATYSATLTGAAEVPPTGSTATGTAEFILMRDGSIHWSLHTTGLNNAVMSHIHAPGAAGQNGPVVVTLFSGGPVANLDVHGVITDANALSTLIQQFNAHTAYVNVHTTGFQNGE